MEIAHKDIGRMISFTHKGRFVKCEVVDINDKGFIGILKNNYKGKNEEWFAGEKKHFFTKECKEK